jgi:hypothetical protein
MYIRIEFKDIASDKTKETQQLFFSIPNGMFLSSTNAHAISSNEIREEVGNSVVFWHLDIEILNKHYGGVMNCLHSLLQYHGVGRVDILPVEGNYHSVGKFDELMTILMQYINGVNV